VESLVPTSVPEPSSSLLTGVGLLLTLFAYRRKG
jgi:hypothetical protein